VKDDVLPLDAAAIPGCTDSLPKVASVGMCESEAKAEGHEVKVGRIPFIGNGNAIALGETKGFVKAAFDAKVGERLDAHMIGAEVTELIRGCMMARTLEATEAEPIPRGPSATLSETIHVAVVAA
jgi:dihydrolipoamide dehydrogenase